MAASADPTHILPAFTDSSRQIRLITILPTSSDWDIHLSVSVHDREDVQSEYIAVSYTWGQEDRNCSITINGYLVEVRFNCWYALQQMRLYSSHRPCWVDSLCIDQRSQSEKSSQVRHMGEIYSGAYEVAACIGALDPADLPFFQQLRDQSGSIDPDTLPKDWFRSLASLAQRPYFSRQWTIQECVLAQHLEVFVGPLHFSWVFLDLYLKHPPSSTSPSYEAIQNLRSLNADISSYVAFEGTRMPLNLARTVLKYKDRCCGNPEDKVYSILSLVPYIVQGRIGLDYSKPLLTILLDFAAAYRTLKIDAPPQPQANIAPRMQQGQQQVQPASTFQQNLWTNPKAVTEKPNEFEGSFMPMIRSIGVVMDTFVRDAGFLTELRHSLTFGSDVNHPDGQNRAGMSHHWSDRGLVEICVDRSRAMLVDARAIFEFGEDVDLSTDVSSPFSNIPDAFNVSQRQVPLPCGHLIHSVSDYKHIDCTKHKLVCSGQHYGQNDWDTGIHHIVPDNIERGDMIFQIDGTSNIWQEHQPHLLCRQMPNSPGNFEVIGFALQLGLSITFQAALVTPTIKLRAETLVALAWYGEKENRKNVMLGSSPQGCFVELGPNGMEALRQSTDSQTLPVERKYRQGLSQRPRPGYVLRI